MKQPSTWRGLAIGAGVVATAINPALGAAVVKAVGTVVSVIDIVKNDNAQ